MLTADRVVDRRRPLRGPGGRRTRASPPPIPTEPPTSSAEHCRAGTARPLAEFAEEPWALPEAVRLTELRLVAAEERVELLLAAGRHAELVPERSKPSSAPTRSGSGSGASSWSPSTGPAGRPRPCAARRTCGATSGEQLGLEPSTGLRRLEAAIAVDDPALRLPSPATAHAGTERLGHAGPTAAPAVPLAATRLIGRDDDVDHLARRARLDHAC